MTRGSWDTSNQSDEYRVSALGRTTSVNEASGKVGAWTNWLIGPRKSAGSGVSLLRRDLPRHVHDDERVGIHVRFDRDFIDFIWREFITLGRRRVW